MSGTAQAAQAGNPLKTLEEIYAALRNAHDLPPGEWHIPRVWKPTAVTGTLSYSQWLKRTRAADLGRRLELEEWTCDAADYLDRVGKIDQASKSQTVDYVYEDNYYLVAEKKIRGFIDQAAQLGRSTVVQLVNASCSF